MFVMYEITSLQYDNILERDIYKLFIIKMILSYRHRVVVRTPVIML